MSGAQFPKISKIDKLSSAVCIFWENQFIKLCLDYVDAAILWLGINFTVDENVEHDVYVISVVLFS